jgi:hypothetical protein
MRKRGWTKEIVLEKLADVEYRLLYAPLWRDIIEICALEQEQLRLLQKLEGFKELDDVRDNCEESAGSDVPYDDL